MQNIPNLPSYVISLLFSGYDIGLFIFDLEILGGFAFSGLMREGVI